MCHSNNGTVYNNTQHLERENEFLIETNTIIPTKLR